MLVDGINVVHPLEMDAKEAAVYVKEEAELWLKKGKLLDKVELLVEDGYVVVKAVEKSPIKRIRRITGYLSEMANFNDAKQAELADRTTHNRCCESVRYW